jgi:hypothetical protein
LIDGFFEREVACIDSRLLAEMCEARVGKRVRSRLNRLLLREF